ncbi:MAG: hypothetical protein WDZ41_02235 [Candidatus Babeliales bacterium]
MNNKQYLSIAIIFSFLNSNMQAMDHNNTLKAIGALFGAGAVNYLTEKASENSTVKKCAENIAINPTDVGKVIGISGSLAALSFLTDNDKAEGLRNLAWRTPVAGGIAAIVYTETFQNIVRRIPGIGAHVTCENSKCTGICNDCKLTKTAIAIGLYRVTDFIFEAWK